MVKFKVMHLPLIILKQSQEIIFLLTCEYYFKRKKKSKLYYPILHYTYTLTVEQKVSVIYKHIHELSFCSLTFLSRGTFKISENK